MGLEDNGEKNSEIVANTQQVLKEMEMYAGVNLLNKLYAEVVMEKPDDVVGFLIAKLEDESFIVSKSKIE